MAPAASPVASASPYPGWDYDPVQQRWVRSTASAAVTPVAVAPAAPALATAAPTGPVAHVGVPTTTPVTPAPAAAFPKAAVPPVPMVPVVPVVPPVATAQALGHPGLAPPTFSVPMAPAPAVGQATTAENVQLLQRQMAELTAQLQRLGEQTALNTQLLQCIHSQLEASGPSLVATSASIPGSAASGIATVPPAIEAIHTQCLASHRTSSNPLCWCATLCMQCNRLTW